MNLIDCASSNVFGGNFSLVGVPSVGASGAIFGTVAVCRVNHITRASTEFPSQGCVGRPLRTLEVHLSTRKKGRFVL